MSLSNTLVNTTFAFVPNVAGAARFCKVSVIEALVRFAGVPETGNVNCVLEITVIV